jgi:hypothetical protein
MSYQKNNNQKTNSGSSSVSEAVALRKGLSFPAVPALQKQGAEEKLQMKKIPAQLMEDEEPLQGKFETVQKVEEEEPLQGKFDTIQKVEEEEPLQGKFETVQKVEEEEPLQGKFDTIQKVEEEEPLQGKFDTIQKVEEEEPLQGKFETVQKVEEEEPLQGKFDTIQKVEGPKDTKQNGLPGNLKSGIENLSGYSMDDVKVHYNSSKPAQLQALAYAQGTDIHIAPGQEKHLPHEAWHVAQQKQGRVKPTMQMKVGVPVNDDAGLENEADVMGAKAADLGNKEQSNSTLQLKQIESSVAQLATPEEEAAFAEKNSGLISMVTNASAVLGDGIWEVLKTNKTDTLGTATTLTGVAGGLTTAAGKITEKVGTSNIAKAAGDITAGVGSSITTLVKSVFAIKKAYDTASGEGSALIGTSQVAIGVLSALQAGSQAAVSIMSYLSSTVPPEITRMIPGLGIAIAACQVIKECYTNYISEQAEAEMTILANDFSSELKSILKKNPEDYPKLFGSEKRGKATFIFWGKTTYVRLLPGLFEEISKPLGPKGKDIFADKYGINRAEVDIDKLIPAIQNYELASKMQEINEKRKIQSSRNGFTGLISLVGAISATFPADGGVSASILLGAASGLEAVQSASKAIQGVARNNDILGGDSNRSDDNKHNEYVNHTKSFYKYLLSIPAPLNKENSEAKLGIAEKMLKSTGANLGTVYSLNGSAADQVKHIVESMKAGR